MRKKVLTGTPLSYPLLIAGDKGELVGRGGYFTIYKYRVNIRGASKLVCWHALEYSAHLTCPKVAIKKFDEIVDDRKWLVPLVSK